MPFAAATRALGAAGLFAFSVLRASKPTRDFFSELTREVYKIGAACPSSRWAARSSAWC
jgi:phospholipid/cholesterol/gamma-HCH transport system permease protein